MSTHADGSYPPFPSGFPSVKLETFSLADMENGDEAVQDRIFETCKSRGFFYLDLNGSEADSMQRDCNSIVKVAEECFKLPQEEKDKYPMKNSIFGYKKAGATRTDAQGTVDTAEFMNVAKDSMLDNTTHLTWPQPILDNKPLFARYMTTAHQTGLKILAILSKKLGLPPHGLAKYHRITEESGDHVRLTRGPPRKSVDLPEIQTPGHTDFGTITILFNWLGGLQLWSDPSRGETGFENIVDPDQRASANGSGRWLWIVPPPPNHAIVNLGDAAVKFTGGVFCSGRHRVVPAPGEQGLYERYSVVYFVRPEDKTILKRLKATGIPEGDDQDEAAGITAKEWIIQQSAALGNTIHRD